MKRLLGLATLAVLLSGFAGGCPQPLMSDLTSSPTDVGGSAAAADTSLTGRPAATSNDAQSAQAADATSVGDGDCVAPDEADSWKLEVLRLVNLERTKAGLSTLVWNGTLEGEAADYACDLVSYNFFAHVNPVTGSTLRDRAATVGYEFRIIGENLAAGQQTPAEAVRAWMDSPSHRDNIMHPDFTELGVAVRLGGDYGIVWVQEFGRPIGR